MFMLACDTVYENQQNCKNKTKVKLINYWKTKTNTKKINQNENHSGTM